jgi:UDP-2,3-diacylglucosamine hydrolase
MHLEIKDKAIFISDAHDNEQRDGFYYFLQKLESGKIKTNQLFLMGDMFDLLVGEVTYTKNLFKRYIDLLNKLSKNIEIFYFEGNHDFNLQSIFPNIKVFKIQKQPALFKYKNKNIFLAHGDIYNGLGYKTYTILSRNSIILNILNFIDRLTDNSISKKILTPQLDKKICYKINNFNNLTKQKIQKYDIGLIEIDFVCEGHYHQNKKYMLDDIKYINFGSFACDDSYFQIHFAEGVSFKEIFIGE